MILKLILRVASSKSVSHLPGGSDGKQYDCNVGDPGSFPYKECLESQAVLSQIQVFPLQQEPRGHLLKLLQIPRADTGPDTLHFIPSCTDCLQCHLHWWKHSDGHLYWEQDPWAPLLRRWQQRAAQERRSQVLAVISHSPEPLLWTTNRMAPALLRPPQESGKTRVCTPPSLRKYD